MGAIADNSYNMYGTGKNQIDFAKQLRLSGYVTPQDQLVGSIVEKLPSIFMSLGQKIVDNCGDNISLNNDGELSAKGEEAQKAINDILTRHGCSKVDELHVLVETKEQEIIGENKKIDSYNTKINNNLSSISDNNQKISALNFEIAELNQELSEIDDDPFGQKAEQIIANISDKEIK